MSRELPTTSQTSSLRTHPRVRRGISKPRSEEHTSELQSPCNLVCRLLLEKKKKTCSYIVLGARPFRLMREHARASRDAPPQLRCVLDERVLALAIAFRLFSIVLIRRPSAG